jgi:hypothetical protein
MTFPQHREKSLAPSGAWALDRRFAEEIHASQGRLSGD